MSTGRVLLGLMAVTLVAVELVPRLMASDDVLATRVTQAGSKPCRDLRVLDLEVRGGCDLITDGGTIDFSVLNAFGDRRLARCEVTYRMHVGPDGRVALNDVRVARP